MTLNFSHHPIFPLSNPPGSGIIPPIQEKGGGDVFGSNRSFCIDPVANDLYCYGRDSGGINNVGSCEPTCTDIVDLLPSDPFGMNLDSTFKAAIAFWIEDMATNYSYEYDQWRDNHACLDHATSMWLPPEPGLSRVYSNKLVDEKFPRFLDCASQVDAFTVPSDVNYDTFASDWNAQGWDTDIHFQDPEQAFCETLISGRNINCQTNEALCVEDGDYLRVIHCATDDEALCEGFIFEGDDIGTEVDGGPPHEGLLFALRHLGVEALLSVERVCKSLQTTISTDPLLWKCLHINHPLNKKLTDDALIQLTQRAEGRLHCLDLVDCFQVTDACLERIIESNPGITKLSVPGCTRLTVGGVVNSLKLFKTPGMPPMKHLRVGGLLGATQSCYDDLKALVGMDSCQQYGLHKPRFFHIGCSPSSCDYESAVDIEVCPKCQDLKLVYDCPREHPDGTSSYPCRGCLLCIPRCINCGRCINDEEYEETFSLDFSCMDCSMYFKQGEVEQHEKAESEVKEGIDLNFDPKIF